MTSGFKYEIKHASEKGLARVGTITTPHGEIQTPAFIPVGTTSLRALESLYWSGVYLIENNFQLESLLTIPKEFAYQVREKKSIAEALSAILKYLDQKGN